MIFRKNIQQSCDALRIAIDAGILTHDVLYRFDGSANGHSLSFLLIEGGLEVLYRKHEIRASAKLLDELHGCPHGIKRRYLQNPRVAQVDDALVLVFLQQRLKHGAGLRAVFCEDIPLANVICALPARERRLVECHIADKIKGVEVLAYFIGQRLKREAFVFEFLDDGLLALGRFPTLPLLSSK
jgi:hypothetical protein